MGRWIFGLFIFASVVLQNITHEFGHVIFARLSGIKVERIQWFTASKLGGSRISYENEPEADDDIVEKKWGVAALGGFVTTLTMGYIFVFIYCIFKSLNSLTFILITCACSMVFLISDLIYFLLGCIFDFGDIAGIMKAFKIKKWTVLLILMILLLANVSIIRYMWY